MMKKIKNNYYLLIFFLLIASCSRSSTHQAQGYIEGRYTYMATSVSGNLQELAVTKGSLVKKGQLLFRLASQPEIDEYNAALENLNESISARDAIAANLTYAKLTYERYKVLVPKNAIQQSQLDNAKSIYNANLAQLAQANASIASTKAALAQAQWKKDQKIIISPMNAIVFDIFYRLGEYTTAHQAILSLLAPADIKVIFYVYGSDLARLKLGQKVRVRCPGCKNDSLGHISFISPSAEYTPPVIYSNETNAKLVFRIEAEFLEQDAYVLHPGQPVTVFYQTS